MDCASAFSVPQRRLQQEFRLTHPAASTLLCLISTTSGMCCFFLYLSAALPTHAPTLLANAPKFLPFIDDSVMNSLFLCLSISPLSLIITGFQSRVWFCLIRRQRQAQSRHRGYSCGGVRCAANWTGQRPSIVSRLQWINLLQDLMRLHFTTRPMRRFCFYYVPDSNKDQIVMVNGVSMDNVNSNYTIQVLKSCGKTANIVSIQPKHPNYFLDIDYDTLPLTYVCDLFPDSKTAPQD